MGEPKKMKAKKAAIATLCGMQEVEEIVGTENFFGHTGHFHDGLSLTHRGTGHQLGRYSKRNAVKLMKELEACGADWNFTKPPKYRSKQYKALWALASPLLRKYPRTDGGKWKG